MAAGCATMTPDECKRADWQELGLRDGLDGQPMSMLDARVKDCAEAGTRADTGRYLAGRGRGLDDYCRLENATTLGLRGATYEGVCPPTMDAEFRRRFHVARAVFDRRSEISNLDARGDDLQRRLREVNRSEEKRLHEAKDDDERRHIRKDFDERRHRLRDELSDLDRRLRMARDELRAAEFALGMLR